MTNDTLKISYENEDRAHFRFFSQCGKSRNDCPRKIFAYFVRSLLITIIDFLGKGYRFFCPEIPESVIIHEIKHFFLALNKKKYNVKQGKRSQAV